MSSFTLNLADVMIYRSFSQEQTSAVVRQRAMATAAIFLEPEFPGYLVDSTMDHHTVMIPAALQGLYYHRLENWKNAAFWYNAAAQVDPVPELQQPILISPWMELESIGNFILPGNSEGWYKRSDTAPGSKIIWKDGGTLVFSCTEIQEEKGLAVLAWKEKFDIPYHHTLVLRAKVNSGTSLIFETVIDGELIRHLTHNGTGSWQDFTIPVEGDLVDYIYLIIREDTTAIEKSCQIEIDSITFLLDETIDDDRTR